MSFVKNLIKTPKILTNTSIISRQICTSKRDEQQNKSESKSESKLVTIMNRERSLNSVVLIGRVGKDPIVHEREALTKSSHSGDRDDEAMTKEKETNKVTYFPLATSEYAGLDAKGEAKFRVDWHRIVVKADRAQTLVNKFVRKGDRVHVTGRLHYNMTRDKNGDSKFLPSIIADDFIFLSKNVDPEI